MAKEIDMTTQALVNERGLRVLAATLLLFLGSASLGAQSTSPCMDSTTTQTQLYRQGYGGIVSKTDTASASFRARASLPTLAASQVRIVGDTTVCRAGSAAFDATLAHPFPAQPALVLEIGTKRVVIKDTGMTDHWLNLVFNTDFSVLHYKIGF